MTLSYLRAIAEFCDRKFEFVPGMESDDLHINDVRKELALKDRVSGGTSQFCSFLFWQLKRNGYKPVIWFVNDFNEKFFVVQVNDYFVSYYDGKIYLSDECPWKPLKYTLDLKEWYNARGTSYNSFCDSELLGCYNYAPST
jgi:hypothetical protein